MKAITGVALVAAVGLVGCTVQKSEPLEAGDGLLAVEGKVSVDPAQVPVVANCPEGQFVAKTEAGWECRAAAGASGSCPAGQKVTGVNAAGKVVCAADDDTTYAAGAGLELEGTVFAVDPSQVPVLGTCADGQVIAKTASGWACQDAPGADYSVFGSCGAGKNATGVDPLTGTLICGDDADTQYTAGADLKLTGTAFSLAAAGFACPGTDKLTGFDAAGAPKCAADAAGTQAPYTCNGTEKVSGFNASGAPVCTPDEGGGASDWTRSGTDLHYTAGNVGVGTDAPASTLDVRGNLTGGLSGTVSVNGGSAVVTGTGTKFLTELNVGDAIKVQNEIFGVAAIASDTALTLSAPHVAGATNAKAYVDPTLFTVRDGTGAVRLYLGKSGRHGIGTASPQGRVQIDSLEGESSLVMRNSANGGTWAFRLQGDGTTPNNLYLDYTALPGVLAVRSNGRVGIGTSAPVTALDVIRKDDEHAARVANAWPGAGGAARLTLAAGDASLSDASTAKWSLRAGGTGRGDWGNSSFSLQEETGGTDVPRLVARKGGNVGIGTTTPAAKLEVAGEVRATSVRLGAIEIAEKGANNGSVTCEAFCQSATWGGWSGSCIAGFRVADKVAVGCAATATGFLQCLCARMP